MFPITKPAVIPTTNQAINLGLLTVFLALFAFFVTSIKLGIPWFILKFIPPLTFSVASPFDQKSWRASLSSTDRGIPDDPMVGAGSNKTGMAVDIVKSGLLTGMTVRQVRKLLGLADFEVDQRQGKANFKMTLHRPYLMIYETSIYHRYFTHFGPGDSAQLLIFFDNDRVSCTRLLLDVKYPSQLYELHTDCPI